MLGLLCGSGPMAEAVIETLAMRCDGALQILRPGVHGAVFSVRVSDAVDGIAVRHGLPLHAVSNDVDLAQQLRQLGVTALVSACWPERVPDSALAAVHGRAVNLHPSRLPAWRGPDPVFWQLRHGCSRIGLSLHTMVSSIDAGPGLYVSTLDADAFQDGIALERTAGVRGAEMALDWRAEGSPVDAGVPRPLIATGRWWRSPQAADYRIFSHWRVARARRFVRLLAWRGVPIGLDNGVSVITGLAHSDEAGARRIRFRDGVLFLREGADWEET